ncbi:MAG: endolytic transglycosylase MltG [Flavobacteriaceae bacterium]|nr:endolytic transglycosylase MltG [Flavobacteriaceae bacterium]
MKNTLLTVLFIFLLAFGGLSIGISYYEKNYSANVNQDADIYIPTNASYDQVKTLIAPYLKDAESFDKAAKSQKYTENIRAGKYKIKAGESNKEVIRRLLLGIQEEVHLQVKNYDDIYELASGLGKKLESDSLVFIKYFNDLASQRGFSDVEELKTYFIPETYYVNWNTSPQELFSRFEKIYDDFWTEERTIKAQNQGLSRMEVYTLASIVQREYMKKDELPVIASLYLNRLHKGMKLQSDPTVIYAERKVLGFKKKVNRVKNVSVDSPYNTYKYKGLPPLPICIPNDFVVDAVLNPENTDYLFMCAIKNTGRHAFTSSAEEHMKNAKAYRDWLDSQGIK